MWFTKSSKDVLKELNVSAETGLSTEEVKGGWRNMDLIN